MRQEFQFNDEQRWTEKYGLLKHMFYTDTDTGLPTEDGAFTGTKFHETVSERPGISPAIAGIALKYCAFSSLKDVGLPLPAYSEEIVRLPLTADMATQYAVADGSDTDPTSGLFKWAVETQKEDTGKGAISVWLNTALNRPDAMFRAEQVSFNRRHSGRGKWAVRSREAVRFFPKITDAWLPKEQWTAEQCLAELRAGRKTLVYVRQTGERDIQPRLQECLQAHGLRVGILKPSLAPAKRATWLKQHSHEWDVLLTNARLVQVGLNLVMFSTAIFFELEWSLAVIWQAMRRLYRPGAPKPVKVYFPVYENTLEEKALNLLGAKMLAAMAFYGDEATGALVDEGDGGLMEDLRRMVMGEMRGLNVGRAEGVFTQGGALVSDSPMGSPTVPSPQLVLPAPATLAEQAARVLVATRRKKAAVAVGQLTMF